MYFFAAWGAVMFVSALNAKALGVSIVAAVALMGVYPDESLASGIMALYVPAVLAAGFRD